MKQEIVRYYKDSFVDYEGVSHNITVCAISAKPELSSYYTTLNCDYNVFREVKLGWSICNPKDSYDEELGKKIAYSKANVAFVALEKGVVNDNVMDALLEKEAHFIKTHPGKFIVGYDAAKDAYLDKQLAEQELETLSNEECEVVSAALEGVDLLKCYELAKRLR